MSHAHWMTWLPHLFDAYGLWALFGVVLLESAGLPLPGETALISSALYAGSTHRIGIVALIAVAFAAAVIGDTIGYLIGRLLGLPLLVRYGRYVHLSPKRLKVGEYLFWRHGGKIVFFGRFVAILRVMAALMAGANLMSWPRFFVMNALGGLCWSALFGTGAYLFGTRVAALAAPLGIALLAVGVGLALAGLLFFRRHEKELEERALALFPDP